MASIRISDLKSCDSEVLEVLSEQDQMNIRGGGVGFGLSFPESGSDKGAGIGVAFSAGGRGFSVGFGIASGGGGGAYKFAFMVF